MTNFIKGKELCKGFFNDLAKPILDEYYPNLKYTAGLLGFGSDILGYDDEVSTDHLWGPRFYLFLQKEDLVLKDEILSVFAKKLPHKYRGFSVNFSFTQNEDGIRAMESVDTGDVSPLIYIYTFEDYLKKYIGVPSLVGLSNLNFLTISEHLLLTLNSASLFTDMLGISQLLRNIHYYPHEVWIYLIACNWEIISQEQAFIKRCFDVGDDLGSQIICARIAQRLMKLSFLYCRQYAPYSKWFGKAFNSLEIDMQIKQAIQNAVAANSISLREDNIVLAQKLLADLHDSMNITEPVNAEIQNYYERNIKVIFADNIASACFDKLKNSELISYPIIGKLCEVGNLVSLTESPLYSDNIKALYGVR